MTGVAGCWACAASGQAAAEPATTLMKSRRRTQPSAARLRTRLVFDAYQIKAAMSALGQKQTCAAQKVMSALNPRKRTCRCTSSCLLWANSRHRTAYSITSSASVSRFGEILTPRVFAVLRLTTNSNLFTSSTGRSAGLAPLRIRPA